VAIALPAPAGERHAADVVVYGATSSGVIAAVAAAREGNSVVLLDPARHVGGMVSGGLGATDTGRREAIGGYAREFFDRVREYYTTKYGRNSPQAKDCSDGFHFEPHVASLTFAAMLRDKKIEPRLGKPLAAVTKNGGRIVALRTADGDEYAGRVFIDATYEGDLMAQAGVRYHVGREGRSQYGEPLAGVQARSPAHQWPVKVNALAADGRPLPGVGPGPLEPAGTGDRKVQAYNFRLCMTRVPENRVPWPKPVRYDPARYELLARYLQAQPGLTVGKLCNPVIMPNGKTDTNNNGPFSTDHIGGNYDYPDGDAATRRQIWQDHVDYTQGFFYFLAHDPRVPPALQAEVNSWGLAKDEFRDTDHWPPQLYVREARRMVGAYLMTQADVTDRRTKPDAVGLGSYNTDSHHCQRLALADGSALNEGDFQVPVRPYAIPYRSLTPKAEECTNLLVPVCCSASHVAYGTIRMEPVYMILGHACGVAAALACDRDGVVQHVPTERLQAKLKSQKSVLDPDAVPSAARGGAPDVSKLAGVVVDDEAAEKTGDWKHSTSAGPFVGAGYLHDGNADKGRMRVRFAPKLPAAGRYELFLIYSPNPNRATNVPVVVHAADGERTVTVNQRLPLKDGKPLRLGVFAFAADGSAWVEIRNDGTDGYVIADAVQFVPAK
jgi:hypothetical protein